MAKTYTEHDLLMSFMESSDIMLFWKDADRRFLGASKSFLDYYGFHSLDDILGKTDEDMGWHIDPDPYRNDESIVLRTGKPIYNSEGKCIIKGRVRYILASKFPIRNKDKEVCGLVGYFRDITEQKESIGKNKAANETDKLTGLINRHALKESAKEFISEFDRKGTDFVILFLDINKFDEINNTFGRVVGDIFLILVAKELVLTAGVNSIVARYKDDKFVILSQPSAQANEEEYVQKMIEHIRSLEDEAKIIEAHPIHTGLSIGHVYYSEVKNYEEALQLAESRMYKDKTSY